MTQQMSPFQEVYGLLRQKENEGSLYGPVFTQEPAIPRTDGLQVFDEGALFSGVDENEVVQATTTIVASSHVPSSVGRTAFCETAQSLLFTESVLPPNADGLERLSPQVIVWWGIKEENGIRERGDFVELSNLDTEHSVKAYQLIAERTRKAARFVNHLSGSSVIWGSWGHGTLEERQQTGLSRGVPTNPLGHLHVVHIDEAAAGIPSNTLIPTTQEAVNFADPWTEIFMQRFGEDLCKTIQQRANTNISGRVNVGLSHLGLHPENSALTGPPGFIVTFSQPEPFESTLATLTDIVGTIETFYQNILVLHQNYYRNFGASQVQKEIVASISDLGTRLGFSKQAAEELAEFVVQIKPTRIQLEKWLGDGALSLEGLLQEYAHGAHRLNQYPNTLIESILRDTLRPEREALDIQRTMPVHATGWYLLDQFELADTSLFSKSFRLFPSLSSTVAAPERILGGIQRRPLH